MKKNLISVFGVFVFLCGHVSAEIRDFSRFKSLTEIPVSGIFTPKVVRFGAGNFYDTRTVLLNEKNEIIPHRWVREIEKQKSQKITVSQTSSQFEGQKENLTDNHFDTFLSFDANNDFSPKITLKFDKKTEVSGISVFLAEGIISPKKVSIRGEFSSGNFTNIIFQENFSSRIPFPEVSVFGLEISFETTNFLRISDISIWGKESDMQNEELVFFAEEGKTYKLFSDADFGQKIYYSTTNHPLNIDEKTPLFSLPKIQKNPIFNPDFDADGLDDGWDLCPKVFDPQNTDIDKNDRGDVCEDPDQDGIFSQKDNCPFKVNYDQKDSDLDGLGDACDLEENRATENSEFLLWGVFGFGALVLMWLVWRSMKKSHNEQ